MQLARVLPVLLVVATAGFLAFRGCTSHDDAATADGSGAAPGTSERAPWQQPFDTPSPDAPQPANESSPVPAPIAPAAEKVPKGTPVAAGANVPTLVPYRAGTKSRYRVTDGIRRKDRATEQNVWARTIWTVATEVVQGDGTGPARVKFTVLDFRYQTQTPGLRVDFDGLKPDKTILEDLRFSRMLKPLIATLGMPVELRLDATGAIADVDGVEPMKRTFLEVVDTFGSRATSDVPDAPSAYAIAEKWTECLFPPVCGEPLVGGETRPMKLTTTFAERWAAISAGKLRVTHDDPDAFRVEFRGMPHMEQLNREPMSNEGRNVVKAAVMASEDCHRAWWRFDRAKGRLLESDVYSLYTYVQSIRVGTDERGQPVYDPRYIETERHVAIDLIDEPEGAGNK